MGMKKQGNEVTRFQEVIDVGQSASRIQMMSHHMSKPC